MSEFLLMWSNWNSKVLSWGLELPLWCFSTIFFSCGLESILSLFFSSHATMFARIFIPKKHRQRFDEAVSQNVINRLCRSKSISEPQGRIRRSRSEDHSDRNRSSKRASSVPRDGEPGGRSEADRSARKSVSGISVHPPIGPNQRWGHIWKPFVSVIGEFQCLTSKYELRCSYKSDAYKPYDILYYKTTPINVKSGRIRKFTKTFFCSGEFTHQLLDLCHSQHYRLRLFCSSAQQHAGYMAVRQIAGVAEDSLTSTLASSLISAFLCLWY